jgi:PHP family Zn ribbon phosphoesterase
MNFLCDFHLHSCLSPCGSLDMSPAAIARTAKAAGLDAVALTDHNSALNAPAFAVACRKEGLHALYGMEVSTIEEIHCLALFETPEAALSFGAILYEHLPDFLNIPEKLGDQVVVNEHDEVLNQVDRLLGNATDIPFSQLPGLVKTRGGLFLPAHIDRPGSGVLDKLGVLPPESGRLLEATRFQVNILRETLEPAYSVVTFSDAHHLQNIGRSATRIEADAFSLASLREALLAHRTTPVLRPESLRSPS